mmetsp:Transcript_118026/g.235122  ORF Transcript_118026/g.235122 Transcript_118026/m.235122 type:complete len:91 (+) Transcript_118026:44-316(+)
MALFHERHLATWSEILLATKLQIQQPQQHTQHHRELVNSRRRAACTIAVLAAAAACLTMQRTGANMLLSSLIRVGLANSYLTDPGKSVSR